jgi:hypothetical protein
VVVVARPIGEVVVNELVLALYAVVQVLPLTVVASVHCVNADEELSVAVRVTDVVDVRPEGSVVTWLVTTGDSPPNLGSGPTVTVVVVPSGTVVVVDDWESCVAVAVRPAASVLALVTSPGAALATEWLFDTPSFVVRFVDQPLLLNWELSEKVAPSGRTSWSNLPPES